MSILDIEGAGLEPERYEFFEGPSGPFVLDRRAFLRGLGGGLVVLCLVNRSEVEAQQPGRGRRPGANSAPREIAAWIQIDGDGHVSACTGKAEVGQNIRTSLAQAVADELRLDPESIRLVMGDTAKTPFDMGTFGSRTTPTMAIQLRRAAAAARERLVGLAADHWKVEREQVEVEGGKAIDRKGDRSIGFGDLTRGQQLLDAIGDDATITPAPSWKAAGRSVAKVNGRDFVTGRHRYTTDQTRPGQLHGKVLRPPGFGAELTRLDSSAAEMIPGVVVVRDGNFVGVAAPDEATASKALAALKGDWKPSPETGNDRELFERLKDGVGQDPRGRGAEEHGSIDEALKSADVKLERTYTVAYIAHAPLEPRAALAEWEGDRLTVWTGTQRPFGVRGELTQAFGLPDSKVRVIVPDTGAGYGGKHTGEAAVEAARLAKAARRPVKVVWTRSEEFNWAYFRPAGVIEATAAASKDGTLTAWAFRNINSGGSGIETPYRVPSRRVAFRPSRSPLRQGSYRALASTANHFARESLMDEMARELKLDPLEFRLRNLDNPRLRAVFEAAAERFGWGGPNKTVGIAGGTEKGGFVATCAEVDLTGDAVRVVRLVTAFECGAIVNPDHLRNQVEGAMVMGLGGALFEAIRFADGKILNDRFSRYRVPRFGDLPALDVLLLDRKDLPSAGAGEAPIIAVAPAIANAIANASGQRLRSLPLVPEGRLA